MNWVEPHEHRPIAAVCLVFASLILCWIFRENQVAMGILVVSALFFGTCIALMPAFAVWMVVQDWQAKRDQLIWEAECSDLEARLESVVEKSIAKVSDLDSVPHSLNESAESLRRKLDELRRCGPGIIEDRRVGLDNNPEGAYDYF